MSTQQTTLTPAEKRALYADGMRYVRVLTVREDPRPTDGLWLRGKNRDGEWYRGFWPNGAGVHDICWTPDATLSKAQSDVLGTIRDFLIENGLSKREIFLYLTGIKHAIQAETIDAVPALVLRQALQQLQRIYAR